jgi:hypothetical protein
MSTLQVKSGTGRTIPGSALLTVAKRAGFVKSLSALD